MSSAYSKMDVPSESFMLSISETVNIYINLFTKSTLSLSIAKCNGYTYG